MCPRETVQVVNYVHCTTTGRDSRRTEHVWEKFYNVSIVFTKAAQCYNYIILDTYPHEYTCTYLESDEYYYNCILTIPVNK